MVFAKLFNLSNDRQVLVTIDNASRLGEWESVERTNINKLDVRITREQKSLELAQKWFSAYDSTKAEGFWIQMKMETDAAEGHFYNLHKTICRN